MLALVFLSFIFDFMECFVSFCCFSLFLKMEAHCVQENAAQVQIEAAPLNLYLVLPFMVSQFRHAPSSCPVVLGAAVYNV